MDKDLTTCSGWGLVLRNLPSHPAKSPGLYQLSGHSLHKRKLILKWECNLDRPRPPSPASSVPFLPLHIPSSPFFSGVRNRGSGARLWDWIPFLVLLAMCDHGEVIYLFVPQFPQQKNVNNSSAQYVELWGWNQFKHNTFLKWSWPVVHVGVSSLLTLSSLLLILPDSTGSNLLLVHLLHFSHGIESTHLPACLPLDWAGITHSHYLSQHPVLAHSRHSVTVDWVLQDITNSNKENVLPKGYWLWMATAMQ